MTKNSETHTDWKKKVRERIINILGYDHMLHNENCHLCNVAVNDIVNLLADARREVIDQIEKDISFYLDRYEYRGKITGQEAKEQTVYMVRQILATLRKEEK